MLTHADRTTNAHSKRTSTLSLQVARLRAGLNRSQAAEYLSVTLQSYSTRERKDDAPQDWINALLRLHTPIDIPTAASNTPAWFRKLRLLAEMTKPELAALLGCAAVTVHCYETGSLRLPDEKFSVFLQALRTGEFREQFKDSHRKGPRPNEWFTAPDNADAETEPTFTGLAQLLRNARESVRMTAKEFGEALGKRQAFIYLIERSEHPVKRSTVEQVISLLESEITKGLDVTLRISSFEELRTLIEQFRFSKTSLGAELETGKEGKRSISVYQKLCKPEMTIADMQRVRRAMFSIENRHKKLAAQTLQQLKSELASKISTTC
ncbi:Cro/C1-type helix-turn-helix domain [Comamonadaceae bacterium]